jgi:hypothetical protein
VADYGLKIWDADGNVTLDTSSRIARLRYSTVAAAGNSGSVVLSDISGKLTVEFGILNEDSAGIPHYVYRSGTTIYWTHQTMSPEGWLTKDTLVLVFLYT